MSIVNELRDYLEGETSQRRAEIEDMVRSLISGRDSSLTPEQMRESRRRHSENDPAMADPDVIERILGRRWT
ncbi:MAG: hypothetical protein WBF53_01620 [Litorimonas sp.]